MNIKRLLFLILICNFLFAFKHSHNMQKATIYIVKSSERLSKTSFELKEGTVILNTKKEYKFYAEITLEEAKGQMLNPDFSKKNVKGIQYNVNYIYENLSSGKKDYYKDQYVIFENGPIIKTTIPKKIKVGKITLKTEGEDNN